MHDGGQEPVAQLKGSHSCNHKVAVLIMYHTKRLRKKSMYLGDMWVFVRKI